ncbi:MAG: hypothetical protein ACLURV_12250 [Gallintestinimicrobium sp.]
MSGKYGKFQMDSAFCGLTAALLAAIAAVVVILTRFIISRSAAGDASSRNEIGISVYRHNTEIFMTACWQDLYSGKL